MITNVKDLTNNTGIYKINYSNGKIYIGQALSFRSRANEHNSKNEYPCDKALKKYDAVMEILQEDIPIDQLDILEEFWISKFNATNKEIGYNILSGGNASGKRGIENQNATFKTQEELNEILNLIINHTELSYDDIAKRFNINKNTVLNIAKGNTYKQENLKYPLRLNNHDCLKKDKISDYFETEEQLILFKNDLKFRWDLSLEEDIPNKWNIPKRVCRQINHGELFNEYGTFTYPIRSKSHSLMDQQQIKNILNSLRTTSKSMEVIGLENGGLHRNTISQINLGKKYPIKGYDYPARKKKI